MRNSNNTRNNQMLMTVIIVAAVVISVVLALVFGMNSADKQDKTGAGSTEKPVKNNEETELVEPEVENDFEVKPEHEPETAPNDVIPDESVSEEPETPNEPSEQEPDTNWNLVLANPWNKLPEDFTVELADIGGGHRVDARIVDDLNEMMNDLARAGHSAFVCSSYRTNQKQTTLYNNEVNEYLALGYSDEEAAIEAGKWVAVPGTSEHQTGLAIDIMSNYYLKLDEGQEDTAEQKWLMENSYKYGFILRYPNDKSDLTGIYYEPWHYRYVGKDVAKEIYEKGICFEEYLAESN